MEETGNRGSVISERDELFQQWLVRVCLWGAVLFVLLGMLDYFAMPGQFAEFLWYRVHVAVALAVIAFLSRTAASRSIAIHRWLGHLAAALSAAAIELMILRSGGHASPYYTGQILLGVCVLGFIPATMGFHVMNGLIIYTVYVLPILVLDSIDHEREFLIANGFMLSVFVTALVLRALSEQALDQQIALQKDLERSQEKYRDLFENAAEPVFLVDACYRYTDANRKAEQMTGFTRDELRQMSILDMIPPEQVPRSTAELGNLKSRGGYERFEGKLRTKDGRWLDIEVSSTAMMRNGTFTGSRDVVRDIAERKRFQEEMRRTREELEQRVGERTAALREMNEALLSEVSVRREAERKIAEQLARQRALSAVQRSIASTLDLSATLNIFIEQVMAQLRPDAAAVMLYDPERCELTFAASRGFRSDRISRVSVRTGQSLAGTVIAQQSRMLIPDLEQADLCAPSPEGYLFRNAFLVRDEGFRSYGGVPLTVKGEIKGIVEVFHRKVFRPDAEWVEFLEALSQQASIAIDNAGLYQELQRSHAEISSAYDRTIEGWSRALDIRDNETHGHAQRAAELAVRVAQELGIGAEELVHIRRGALLHDIGKLGVPDSILLKPGRLTDGEMNVMKRHPEIAYDILSPIPFLKDALAIPYLHHERWDGSGYPRGMRGEEIPMAARIFAVIDVWDALLSRRPYRAAWDEQRVLEHLIDERERHFDPVVVGVFLEVVRSPEG